MIEDSGRVVRNETGSRDAESVGGIKVSHAAGDLRGALDQLEPGKPLILNDGFIIADGGYLVSSQYIDIGATKLLSRPSVLVKATEAEYGLEHAPNIQISAPYRFRNYGETLIQDDQEGHARRARKTEDAPRCFEEITREQERAFHLLGEKGAKISETRVTGVHMDTESLTFGRSSWIYSTSILPASGEWETWRASLPNRYGHESTIRQPAKFAQALGAMFADQTGPRGKQAHFNHFSGIRSFHSSQAVFHGPVCYADDVLGFLRSLESDPAYMMYQLFVKHSRYQEQREYRFVLHCETPVESETLRLNISGAMRDALARVYRVGQKDKDKFFFCRDIGQPSRMTYGAESGVRSPGFQGPGFRTSCAVRPSSARASS